MAAMTDSRQPEKIRVLLAEDNADLRITITMLLADEPDMDCVASTGVLADVGGLAELHDAQVVVLDLQLQGGSALPVLPGLRAARPQTAFLIHSGHSNPGIVQAAREAGASAYVLKTGDIELLLAAIRKAVRAK